MTNKEIDALWDEVMRRPVANFRYDFARLVAAYEREECAKVCDVQIEMNRTGTAVAKSCVKLIRRRGKQ